MPFFLFSLRSWLQLLLDLTIGGVQKLEGYVELEVVSVRGATLRKLQIQNLVFDVTKPVLLAFKNNELYSIYFSPYSKRILSAERLRDSAD